MEQRKRLLLLLSFALSVFIATYAAVSTRTITVTNPATAIQKNVPVVLPVNTFSGRGKINVVSCAVFVGKEQIPSQLDDLNHDGIPDEMAFLVDLSPKQKLKVTIYMASDSSLFTSFALRTHAQMWRKNPVTKEITPTIEESSPTGNLYQSLHHHGPAFESEYMAYRLYFDEKQTVDIYGKKKHRLELMDTKWYPTDQQLAEGYGDDILWVKATSGCGTLKGWDGEKAISVAPVSNRTARILASGPVRSVVEMEADGWQYQGKTVNLRERFIIYAGHRDVEVHVFQNEETTLCVGVQTFFDQSEKMSDISGVQAIWGTGLQYPYSDNPRAQPQTVGLAVYVPGTVLQKPAYDNDNLLLIIKGKDFKYHFMAVWDKEDAGFKTATDFFDYVKEWKGRVSTQYSVNNSFRSNQACSCIIF